MYLRANNAQKVILCNVKQKITRYRSFIINRVLCSIKMRVELALYLGYFVQIIIAINFLGLYNF